jgi:hypothetical protein
LNIMIEGNPNPVGDDELIDLSKPASTPDSHPQESPDDRFEPPKPKAAIFHTKDNPPDIEPSDPTPTRLMQELDQDSPSLFTHGEPVYKGLKWVNRPIAWVIAVIAAIVIFLTLPFHISWWLIFAIFAFMTSYAIYPGNRYRYRYNMDWDANADLYPYGCGYGLWRWWW